MSRFSYKTLFIILLFLLIPIVFLIRINQKATKTSAAWWNNSWNYRMSINIGNSQSSQTNIQIKIFDNYDLSSLITAGKIQASLNDLRFIDVNGESISYWIEDSTNNSVDIWGILPSLPTGDSIIYMYYGNPSAPSVNSTSNMTIGGTMTFINGYRIHTFKDSGTLANTTISNVEILVIAGGGGGAAFTGGGGGAGGLIYNTSFPLTAQNYSVTVGLGGSGQVGTANPGNGSDGQNSIFDSLIAIGGGGAGTNSGVGRSGGSGGGAGHNNTPGGAGTPGQGNNGSGGSTTAPNYGAGGGGGAGAVGGTPTNYAGGNGGVGLTYSISGTSQYYAGGGGGGTYMGGTYGIGGSGGGGSAPAGNATPNTGGGGGGQINNQANAGNGASGIVILRYLSANTNSPAVEETRPQGIKIGGTGNETHSSSLVAYYKFDEGYGTIIHNSGTGGSSFNGTLAPGTSSPTWIENGKIYKGLYFDNNDYIDLPNSLGYTNQVTVFTWFKSNGSPAGSYHIVMGGQELEISIPVSGQIRTGVFTNTRYVSNHGSGLVDNQWHHIGFTFDGSTKKSYIDGRFVGEQTGIGSTLRSSFAGRRIGQFGTNPSYFLNGYLDEIKIFDYALSEDEIKREYNQGSSVVFSVDKLSVGNTSTSAIYCVPGSTDSCLPPIAEWNFEESVGTSAFDTSGNANHGSLAGTSLSTGKIGQALKFKSSNNSYFISSNDPGTMSSGTYSLWVKPSTINANMGWIDSNFDIFQWTGNLLYFRAGNQSSVSISNWTPDTWHYLTLSWNGSNYFGYIDGNQVTTGVQSGSRSGPINLGRVDNNYYFDGSIDQVRIYNYARTPAQIAWDYNQGAPIGWWKMDECTGTDIKDWSFNGHPGIANIGAGGSQTSVGTCTTPGTAWGNGANGKINSSLSLDGTDDYILISSISNPQNLITLSAWIKTSGGFSYGGIIGNNYTNTRLCKDHDRTTGNEYSFDWNGQWNVGLGIPESVIEDNNWHLLTGVYDGSYMRIYLDGKEYGKYSYNGTIASPYNGLVIGRNYYSVNNYYFKGLIDNVRIYNYALTPNQVKQIYNGGAIYFDKLD